MVKKKSKQKKVIATKKAPQAIGPYSQGICVEGAKKIIFFSGQVALNPKVEAKVLSGTTAAEQTKQVMNNIKGLLEAVKADFKDIVKTTIFLQSMEDFAQVNEIYAKHFKGAPPARSTVAVAKLPLGALVEIECIVVI